MVDPEPTRQVPFIRLKLQQYWFLILLFVLACQSNPDPKHVYITDTGTKFHLENCRHLKLSKHIITREVALKRGYGSCKVCKPLGEITVQSSTTIQKPLNAVPEKPLEHSIRCSAKTMSGIQCKRMTKNRSGKCWQHDKK